MRNIYTKFGLHKIKKGGKVPLTKEMALRKGEVSKNFKVRKNDKSD